MKERPILFSAPMVRALLAGTKTQTRRIAELNTEGDPSPKYRLDPDGFVRTYIGDVTSQPETDPEAWMMVQDGWERGYRCPYGKPGDRLWVRETLRNYDAGWRYDADQSPIMLTEQNRHIGVAWAHHQERDVCVSIHMPRWASRITLQITGVRVERLQEIDHDDAEAEGIEAESEPTVVGDFHIFYRNYQAHPAAEFPWFRDSRESYRSLWESINGPGSWDANPWVWVVEFKRVMS